MNPAFTLHLKHNWPLGVVVIGLFLYIPIVLLSGIFYTNRGGIRRSKDPVRYWRWVMGFTMLFSAALAVLLGSYALSKP